MHKPAPIIYIAGLTLACCLWRAAMADQPPAPGSAAPVSVLAEAGGHNLTSQNVGDLLAMYSWLLEAPLTPTETTRVTSILIGEFNANPDKAAANYAGIHQKLAQLEAQDPVLQCRTRADAWKALAKAAPTNPSLAAVLKALSDNSSLLLVTPTGVVTQPQIDALIASDDLVAQIAGLPPTTPAARAELTRELVAKFPSFDEQGDPYEAVTDAEERSLSLRLWMESSPGNKATVLGIIKAKVHSEADVPPVTHLLENTALMMTRMSRFAVQQKIIEGVVATNEAQLDAIRAAGEHYMNHESRGYQHGEPTPGPNTGLGPQ